MFYVTYLAANLATVPQPLLTNSATRRRRNNDLTSLKSKGERETAKNKNIAMNAFFDGAN
jgi:hypothetical protein